MVGGAKFVRVFVLATLCLALVLAHAQAPTKERGASSSAQSVIDSKSLSLKGDVAKGKTAYKVCSACHLPSGSGRHDGTYPQIAGQHAAILIHQLEDIRAGRREAPTMFPFVMTLTDSRELADVAAYISRLCIPLGHGRYEGKDATHQATVGKPIYEKACQVCHGNYGEGNQDRLYPAIVGQHYKYLLRQMTEMRDGKRHSASPGMVRILKQYSDTDLIAIAAYLSDLTAPGAMCTASGNR